MFNNYDSLPGKATSLWLATTTEPNFPSLQSGLMVDVIIIGGGLVGLTAATLLKAEGKTVAVLEANRIVQGVTGYTTAKVTSLHSLIYDYLMGHFGEEKARAYANANQAAIEQIADLVHERQIDCDFTRTEAYTYTESDDEIDLLRDEVAAALKLGLPATFVTETPLPFPVKAAVRFDHQAQFHPRKYLLALAQQIPGEGSFIFEETRVVKLDEGEPCVVTTEQGTIAAQAVIIASHFPFDDKVLYASRLQQHRPTFWLFVSPDQCHTVCLSAPNQPTRCVAIRWQAVICFWWAVRAHSRAGR
ncbi:MAG: FAD-binding oxidoreductase [Chloroflexi bacterium]|nr:FAD-binding oxidoreductase [Chloroflexota bacterium]